MILFKFEKFSSKFRGSPWALAWKILAHIAEWLLTEFNCTDPAFLIRKKFSECALRNPYKTLQILGNSRPAPEIIALLPSFFYPLSQIDQSSDISFSMYSKQNVCVCPSYSFHLVFIQHIRSVLLIQALSTPTLIRFSNGLAWAKNSKIIFLFSNLIALPMGSMKTDDMFILVLTTENALKVCKLSTSLTSLHLSSSQHPPWYSFLLEDWLDSFFLTVKLAQLRDKNPAWISKEKLNI